MTFRPAWMLDLQPASWRGHAFGVESIDYATGRRTATHEYPYRPLPWVEDLGLATQVIAVRGFLVGDDVAARYAALKADCEETAYGEFVHPRVGSLTCALTAAAFAEEADAGNVVRFSLSFVVSQVESSITLWPRALAATDRLAGAAALEAQAAGERSFLQRAGEAIQGGAAAVAEVGREAQSYVNEARAAVSEATRALNVASGVGRSLGVPGLDFSRYLPIGRVSAGLAQLGGGVSVAANADRIAASLAASGNRAVAGVNALGDKAMNLVSRL